MNERLQDDERREHRPAGSPLRTPRLAIAAFSKTAIDDVEEAARYVGAATDTVADASDPALHEADGLVLGLARSRFEDAIHFVREVRMHDRHLSVVAAAGRLTAGEVVKLMRSGATDVLILPMSPSAISERLTGAIQRTRDARHAEERSERLARICRQLSDERREVTNQVEQLSAEMVGAYQAMADDVGAANVAAQVGAAISDELDVEALLRKTLEFVLDRVGITNAVVFLPNSAGDWAIGAYVNADMPGDTSEMMLDQLADVLPAAFAGDEWLIRLDHGAEVEACLGESAAEWLGNRSMIVLPCDHPMGGHEAPQQRIAVVSLFRDGPFEERDVEEMKAIGRAFTAQLAKVVRIHNRTAEDAKWFGFDVGAPEAGGEEFGDDGEWWKDAA